jgi:hypothetical protein
MASANKASSSNLKIMLTFISIASILGLWMVFASKAQREATVDQAQPQPVVSGEIYFPEMPTLVPMVDLNQQMVNSQPEQAAQELRNVSVPTAAVKQSAPQVGIQSIVIGNSNTGGGNTSSSQPAPQTSTKAS